MKLRDQIVRLLDDSARSARLQRGRGRLGPGDIGWTVASLAEHLNADERVIRAELDGLVRDGVVKHRESQRRYLLR